MEASTLNELAENLARIRSIKEPLDKPMRKKVKKWLKAAAEGVSTSAVMQSSGLGKVVKKLCKHQDDKVKGWCKSLLENWLHIAQQEAAGAAAAVPPMVKTESEAVKVGVEAEVNAPVVETEAPVAE